MIKQIPLANPDIVEFPKNKIVFSCSSLKGDGVLLVKSVGIGNYLN